MCVHVRAYMYTCSKLYLFDEVVRVSLRQYSINKRTECDTLTFTSLYIHILKPVNCFRPQVSNLTDVLKLYSEFVTCNGSRKIALNTCVMYRVYTLAISDMLQQIALTWLHLHLLWIKSAFGMPCTCLMQWADSIHMDWATTNSLSYVCMHLYWRLI